MPLEQFFVLAAGRGVSTGAASQPRICVVSPFGQPALSPRRPHSHGAGPSLGAHLPGDASFLTSVPNRFEFVFHPEAWVVAQSGGVVLREIGTDLLRGIRVTSKEEQRARIELYLKEVNEEPTVFKWKSGNTNWRPQIGRIAMTDPTDMLFRNRYTSFGFTKPSESKDPSRRLVNLLRSPGGQFHV
jgi:hypothetical protein